jgi:hypothetical protein
MLTPKANVSSNFDDRPNGGILRPPAMLMFYDFAPHGDGANNDRRPMCGHFALRLLFISECVVAEVAAFALLGARTLEHAGTPNVRKDRALQKRAVQPPNPPANYFAGSNSGLSKGCVSGFVAGKYCSVASIG